MIGLNSTVDVPKLSSSFKRGLVIRHWSSYICGGGCGHGQIPKQIWSSRGKI